MNKEPLRNCVFALETNLGSLERRVLEGRTEDALEVVKDLKVSLERLKELLSEKDAPDDDDLH